MLSNFEFFVANRYLRSRRKEVFISVNAIISVLGVAVSVMVLNMVLSIMTGFEVELRNKLVGANAHIIVRRKTGNLQAWKEVVGKSSDIQGVKAVFPYTYNQAMLTSKLGSRGLIIKGIANEIVPKSKTGKIFKK